MLKLTRKVEYSLMALRHMQGKSINSVSSTREIANQYNIPVEILAKTLQHMANVNIIEAINGPRGGYRIKAKLKNINLVDFFEKVEGTDSSFVPRNMVTGIFIFSFIFKT